MRALAAYLRGLDPHLPRQVWLVQAGGVVNSLGNGIVFPSPSSTCTTCADLAPDRLRGRYFALSAMSWSAGSILGPAVGGALLGWHPLAVWPIAAAVCLFSAAGCLALERRLPERPPHATARADHADPAGSG